MAQRASKFATGALERVIRHPITAAEIRIFQHFMDAPVAQPRRKRVADLTGLKIWPCSHHVLAHLEANLLPRLASSSNSPLRILELGAGTGALGISLGVSPAPTRVVVTDPAIDVHFADSTSNTLDWLRANVEINPVGERVVARKLLWGDSADTEAVLSEQIWPDADAGFDVVLGSDLLYNPDEYEGLVKTLVRTVRGATLGVLGHTHRHDGEKRFFRMLDEHFDIGTEAIDGGITLSTLTRRDAGVD